MALRGRCFPLAMAMSETTRARKVGWYSVTLARVAIEGGTGADLGSKRGEGYGRIGAVPTHFGLASYR